MFAWNLKPNLKPNLLPTKPLKQALEPTLVHTASSSLKKCVPFLYQRNKSQVCLTSTAKSECQSNIAFWSWKKNKTTFSSKKKKKEHWRNIRQFVLNLGRKPIQAMAKDSLPTSWAENSWLFIVTVLYVEPEHKDWGPGWNLKLDWLLSRYFL